VKITDISVQVVDAGKTMLFAERLIMNLANVVVRIKTDEGLEGVAGASTYLGATGVAAQVAELRPLLIGEDPLYRERIWQRLNEVSILMVPPHSIAVIDAALWDLAGRMAGLPVYKLLGAVRDRVPAYASSLTYTSLAEFQREIDGYLKSGFKAVKLHVWGDPERDIELCRAIRAQVGPGIALMVDAVGSYSLNDALRVGRVLDALGFEWFEMPLRDSHIAAYKTLADALDIAVTSGEVHTRSFEEAANYLTTGAWDIVRIDALISGGITGTKKAAALAEGLGLRCEIHSFGYTLNQAANLQVIGSAANAKYFECPMPVGTYGDGMRDVIDLEPDGTVCIPDKPGLGVDVDWEKMDAMTVARF